MLNPLSRTPVTEEVLEKIKGLITSGKVKVGERLPTETQLSTMLGVSRNTVREVFVTLQAQGFIEIRRGKGAFVLDISNFYERTFIEWFQKNEFKIQELLEVRATIEPYCAFLAAQKITEEEISELEKIQEVFIDSIYSKNVDNMVANDEKFHLQIIKACRNELLEFLYSSVVPAIHEYRKKVFGPPAEPVIAIEAHARILQAIKERNPRKTYDAMMEHIQESKADVTGIAQMIVSSKNNAKLTSVDSALS